MHALIVCIIYAEESTSLLLTSHKGLYRCMSVHLIYCLLKTILIMLLAV